GAPGVQQVLCPSPVLSQQRLACRRGSSPACRRVCVVDAELEQTGSQLRLSRCLLICCSCHAFQYTVSWRSGFHKELVRDGVDRFRDRPARAFPLSFLSPSCLLGAPLLRRG